MGRPKYSHISLQYSLLFIKGNVINYILLYHFDTFYLKNDSELHISKVHSCYHFLKVLDGPNSPQPSCCKFL